MHEVAGLLDAGLRLLAPVGGGPPGRDEVALQVDGDDVVPLLLRHVHQHPVAQDAGVVHEDVEIAERLDGRIDQPLTALPIGDAVAVGDGFPAHRLDLLGHRFGGRLVVATAVGGTPEVVHDHLRAFSGEQQRMLAANATSRAGDDGDPAFERSHAVLPYVPSEFGGG